MNNNLQLWHQSETVNLMRYQNSFRIPLNRITNRDEEMTSQKRVKDIASFRPLAAALEGQRLLKNCPKEKGTLP